MNFNLTKITNTTPPAPGPGQVYGPADVAEMLGLKPQQSNAKKEYHGPNPTGPGATHDGFFIREDGTAYDRKLGKYYSSREVALLAGLEPNQYEPCITRHRQNSMSRGTNLTKPQQPIRQVAQAPDVPQNCLSLEERGLRPETQFQFEIKSEANGWMYPTYQVDGTPGRKRWKNRKGKSPKYAWLGSNDAIKPPGYNLHNLNGAKEVWLVGGEVDVWTAHQAGLPAVCTFGETQGHRTLMTALRSLGVEVVHIVLDNDEAGHRGALQSLEAAREVGLACTVRVLDGPAGFDVNDLYRQVSLDDGEV